ncbi:hypothetical protein GW17_00056286, partial [Ensete ventricosum]
MIIQQHQLVDESMSNLTSASGEASVSSNQQSSFASPNPNPTKKKRNLPGNPGFATRPPSSLFALLFPAEISPDLPRQGSEPAAPQERPQPAMEAEAKKQQGGEEEGLHMPRGDLR